jgi:dipeptidyl aminopeptidase/acylaminoacyl peptidase
MKKIPCRYFFLLIQLISVFSLFCISAQSFSVPDILSAPYPENLTAGSNSLAWTLNDQGRRNIWMASGPDFKPVQLTHHTLDDGQKLSDLVFTPDDAYLLYVRGGGAMQLEKTDLVSSPSGAVGIYRTGAGTAPNPDNAPRPQERAIWVIPTKGGIPWKLVLGSNPVISPKRDGKTMVLFTRQGQFYETLLDPGAGPSEPKPLFTIQGSNNNPVWSPDGQSLLFVSDRDSHSLIGVYRRNTETIHWIMPGADRDMSPVWSPDGSQIAFIRVPGKTKHELFDLTGEWPFGIWVAKSDTGLGHEIWRTPETGGWAQWYPPYAGWYASALRWTSNNRILFYSEHQDRLHIYGMTTSGQEIRDLTPGPSQVWGSAVSPDGKTLYYSSNRQNLDFRHIWKTRTQSGTPIQLTRGASIETDPVLLNKGSLIAFRQALTTKPQAVTLKRLDTNRDQILSPKALPKKFPLDLVTPEPIIFPSDNFQIHCQLFMPKTVLPGHKLPAIIFVHGGPFRQMLLGWGHHASYAKTYAMNQYLANHGYVVLSVNYRSGTGYGRSFRRAENQGPRGASEYRDILAARDYLGRLPGVDPKKIGIWGNSCGGYLTGLALARNSDRFAAGVALSGIYDFSLRATNMSVPGGEWGLKGEKGLAQAFQSSPMADIEKWKSPVLLVHGDDDRSVIFEQTINLVQGLRNRNIDMELIVFPGESHDYALHRHWVRTFEAASLFFDRVLK